jgi:hypothetical protein
MPGSWEIHQQANVLCGILHVDVTTVAWAFGLRNLKLPGGFLPLAGMPYDMARTQACHAALQHGCSHIFFLDSDVIPPADAVLRLLSHNQPIVSGVYCRRSPPHGLPVAIARGGWVQLPAQPCLLEVDLVGAGCLLIRRDVLERFAQSPNPKRPEKVWFDWRVDAKDQFPEGQGLSEDFSFCARARLEFGYKVLLDTGLRCKHVGSSQADYGNMLPLETLAVT